MSQSPILGACQWIELRLQGRPAIAEAVDLLQRAAAGLALFLSLARVEAKTEVAAREKRSTYPYPTQKSTRFARLSMVERL